MTCAQIANLASAALGVSGTVVLFFGSYALQPFEGATWAGEETEASNDKIRIANARRIVSQRIGLVLLCLSFLVQAAVPFL